MRVFTHPTTWGGRWKGFSHGGTLKALAERFRDYICEGKQMPIGWLGPERFDDSNIWGYDEVSMRTPAPCRCFFRQKQLLPNHPLWSAPCHEPSTTDATAMQRRNSPKMEVNKVNFWNYLLTHPVSFLVI